MKNLYLTPDVLILHVDAETILCTSFTGNFSGSIDSVEEGTDYGDL
jgi:hypothetical protein